MMKEEPERIAVRLWLGLGSIENVDDWAEEVISASNEVDPVVFDILVADRTLKIELFMDFVKTRLGFECVSSKGVTYVEEILADICLQVLQEKMAVPRFCGIVNKLDAAFLLPTDSSVTFPEALSGLWNACDWCDEKWTLDNQTYLAEEIEAARQRILKKLSETEMP